jgi:hypothetical protein
MKTISKQPKSQKEISQFFQCLGEIWRDITAIEFLMRCAIAKKKGEIKKFPKPPYTKGRVYVDYPRSFSIGYFAEVAGEFNKYFPEITIPQELIDLRNAMAHGLTAEINGGGIAELVRFKKVKEGLKVEFNMALEPKRIAQIRQSLKELRGYIMKECDDNKV